MRQPFAVSARPRRPKRDRRPRRTFATLTIAVLTAVVVMVVPSLATADTSSTLTVVGTSDVSDSGLIPNLIQPEFQNAFPQYTFRYVGSATGAAIQNAENGTGGPSALIVHAASLENQFVAGGFSFANQFGSAIFTNDFVLGGPATADPANALTDAPHDIANAFADIASAGNSAAATFVSRGGTNTAPGTTVAEHQIWKLVNDNGLTPASLVLCNVSAADGGGMTPIKSSVQATSGQPCPDSGSVSGADLPTWYTINSVNQASNVIATDTCTAVSTSGPNSCYVFTDRGTFDFLASGTDPAGSIPHLRIVTRDNSASAPGGANALINYFHVYIINPASPGETVNLSAALQFLSFLTTPPFQRQLKNYLAVTNDPGGAPFVADASPTITESGLPAVDPAGKPVTVTGTVTNAEPGFPPISGKPVSLDQLEAGLPVRVASGATDATGHYSITFTPTANASYQVSTAQISQIENLNLSPAYGDILSPAATNSVAMNVQGAVSISSSKASTGGATVIGSVRPGAADANGTVTVVARPQGSTGRFEIVGGTALAPGQSTYVVPASLRPGKWQLETTYQDLGQLLSSTSASVNLTLTATSVARTVGFKKTTVKNGALTVSGTLTPGPTSSGARVELLALQIGTVKRTTKKTTRAGVRARSAAVSFRQVAHTSVGTGKTRFTIKAKLKRGFRWALQLEYVQRGQTTALSRVSTVDIH